MGNGFQISNKRNNRKAISHQIHENGLYSITSMKATISSQTILLWSGTPRFLPAISHRGMPIRKRSAMMGVWSSAGVAINKMNIGMPTIVPKVPGAFGLSPLPNPRAKKWAGFLNKNLKLGEVIKACLVYVHDLILF